MSYPTLHPILEESHVAKVQKLEIYNVDQWYHDGRKYTNGLSILYHIERNGKSYLGINGDEASGTNQNRTLVHTVADTYQ